MLHLRVSGCARVEKSVYKERGKTHTSVTSVRPCRLFPKTKSRCPGACDPSASASQCASLCPSPCLQCGDGRKCEGVPHVQCCRELTLTQRCLAYRVLFLRLHWDSDGRGPRCATPHRACFECVLLSYIEGRVR